jgi:hypothetical protein
MIPFNYLILTVSSLIPLLVGAIWYNPRLFGVRSIENDNKQMGHKPSVYIIALILSFMYSIAMSFQVIHQLHFQSLFMNQVGFLAGEGNAFKDFEFIMAAYKSNYRSFSHGAFHGFLNSIFIILPILTINGLFENKSWKYILTHWGFWAVSSTIMGAIICQFY